MILTKLNMCAMAISLLMVGGWMTPPTDDAVAMNWIPIEKEGVQFILCGDLVVYRQHEETSASHGQWSIPPVEVAYATTNDHETRCQVEIFHGEGIFEQRRALASDTSAADIRVTPLLPGALTLIQHIQTDQRISLERVLVQSADDTVYEFQASSDTQSVEGLTLQMIAHLGSYAHQRPEVSTHTPNTP